MKCCLYCRKLEADSGRGISAAPDESDLLLWRWELWSGCPLHWRWAGKEEQEPCCRVNNSGLTEPASRQLAIELLLVWPLPLVWLHLSSHPPRVTVPFFLYLQPELQANTAYWFNLPCVGWEKTQHPENLLLLGLAVERSCSQMSTIPGSVHATSGPPSLPASTQ